MYIHGLYCQCQCWIPFDCKFAEKWVNLPKAFAGEPAIFTTVVPAPAGALVQRLSCLLGKSEIAGSNPTLAFKFQRNKMFLPCSFVKIQYSGEPQWPRGSVLGLRPPGLKFRIMCLEGSVNLIHHPQEVLLAQFSLYVHKGGLKSHSFHFFASTFYQQTQDPILVQCWATVCDAGPTLIQHRIYISFFF